MEIRDVVHGSISIEPAELPVIDSPYFQRLRQIKQLGFAEHSFPSATHNRYIHSLGAMHTASRAFEAVFRGPGTPIGRLGTGFERALPRLRAVTRLAALLHDVGHGPLSHTTEFAMPDVRTLGLAHLGGAKAKPRKATHEDYTLKIILDSGLTPLLARAGRDHGFTPLHVAALIDPAIELKDSFFTETCAGEPVDFRPILKQLISSELDADRMDYLRRDSLHAGVSYGQFDFDWLVGNLTSHVKAGKCYLALQHRALYAFEDFLISRFHMFLMVYFHYKSVVYDSMLGRYFESADCDYALPSDIERYCECDDASLYAHLAKSRNEWARRIVERRPFRMLIELHSGIPATQTAHQEQARLLARVERDLGKQGIFYLEATSTGELSKYFKRSSAHAHKAPASASPRTAPIFVAYDNHYSKPSFIPLEQCTDLFDRYSEKRSITRLYVSPEDYVKCRNQGRDAPLAYEDSGTTFQEPARRS